MALLGSRAIGAGMSIRGVLTDQRGFLRPNTPSLGAFDPRATPPVTTTQLTSIVIIPNPAARSVEMTLTVQVSNPIRAVDEGMVPVTLAGQSASGAVVNGSAIVQVSLPSQEVIGNQAISLSYADNSASGIFDSSSAMAALSLNLWNILLPADVTLTPGGELDAVSFFLASLDFIYTNQQLTEFRFGPLDLHVQYLGIAGQVLVMLNGIPWQVELFGPQGQSLGIIPLVPSNNALMTLLSLAL